MAFRLNVLLKFAVCLTLVMLMACQPRTPAKVPDEPTKQEKPFEVTEILVGPVSNPTSFRPMTPKDPINITVRTTGSSESTELLVRVFTLANGASVGTRSIRLDSSSAMEQSIRFQNDAPWEPGRYLIEVTLDGKLAGHRELEIYSEEVKSIQ